MRSGSSPSPSTASGGGRSRAGPRALRRCARRSPARRGRPSGPLTPPSSFFHAACGGSLSTSSSSSRRTSISMAGRTPPRMAGLAPLHRGRRVALAEPLDQLAHKAGLADAGLAEHRDQVRALLAPGAVHQRGEQGRLLRAADQGVSLRSPRAAGRSARPSPPRPAPAPPCPSGSAGRGGCRRSSRGWRGGYRPDRDRPGRAAAWRRAATLTGPPSPCSGHRPVQP